ncbi:MAG: hypothetical protein ACFFCO_04760, partial [Promethearchaeota archaeon]
MKDLEKLNKALERTRSSLRSCREFVEAQFNSIQDAMQEISQTIPKAESALGELTAQLKQHQESLDDLRERISDIERLNLLREEETATIQTQ